MKTPGIILLTLVGIAAAAAPKDPWSFRTDVLPVLTKAGCNSGACHGAATGQGGFKLSLLGYDPEEDYDRVTRELGGRRVDLADPEHSLLLRKPAHQLEHEGGRRLSRHSQGYELLRRWIADAAPYGPPAVSVVSIQVEPSDVLFSEVGRRTQLKVTAQTSEGQSRDVTALALYTSNDEAIAGVSAAGEVAGVGRGLTSVMVRYSGQVAATRIAVPLGDRDIADVPFPRINFVDDFIHAELIRLRVPPVPLSNDAEFLRRASLDLTGRLPDEKTVQEFLQEQSSQPKRERLIDQLLASEAFVDFWTLKLGDLLLLNGTGPGPATFHRWLREQVATNAPLDQLTRGLLTATGDPAEVGPAHFLTLANDPRDLSEHVGRMFLGTQIGCARCHAHPTDQWTQTDYYEFAAYFAGLRREGSRIEMHSRGELAHPKTGRRVTPKPLGAGADWRPVGPRPDGRYELADWLTASSHPRFSRAWANRIWKNLLGRGLVEPVDDLRPTNPPTHPGLLDALARDLSEHRFSLRHLIRTIVTSRTYQLSSRTTGVPSPETQLYSRALVKPLPAPVFADAIAQVTGIADRFEGYPEGTRAVQLQSPATPSSALDVLGRCQRKRTCDGPVLTGGGLAQALHLINGPTINAKLQPSSPSLLRWQKLPTQDLVRELYRRALTRDPEEEELRAWEKSLSAIPSREEAVQDLVWTLLNSREFAVNH